MWPGEIVHGRGTWTHSRTLCTHLQASGRAGLTKRDDVEKGGSGNMENPVQWRQGRKRHEDNDPKPCRQNTACAAEQSRVSLQEERSPRTTALRSCRGGPGMPFPVSPSRWLPALVTREREAPSRSANITWRHVLPGSTLQAFLESGLFSQVDSGVWRKGLRVVLPCR